MEKKSLISKMPGTYEEKFANTRLFLSYMMAHPGKKLLFMGCEIGQFKEWDFSDQIEWFLLEYETHKTLKNFVAKLNFFYLENSTLWEVDYSWDGFSWISHDDFENSIIAFRRMNKKGEEIIIICNFTPITRHNYRIGAPKEGYYSEIFNSDSIEYGGHGIRNLDIIMTNSIPIHGYENSMNLTIPPLAAIFLKYVTQNKEEDLYENIIEG